MKRILITSLILSFVTTITFAQEKSLNNNDTEKKNEAVKSQHEIKVNENFIAKYNKFMTDGEYVSLWETVKDYSLQEMNGFYQTYKNFEFTENTTYAEIKQAYENEKEEYNLADESTEEIKNIEELLSKIQQ